MASYEAAGGSLRLKGVSDSGIKKKSKKKKKNKKQQESAAVEEEQQQLREFAELEARSSAASSSGSGKPRMTAAELAFEKARQKKLDKELFQKAQKSHKERILDFNAHLDSLTEHFDIPKVSWTK